MTPLWLLPVVALVAAVPFLVAAVHTLQEHTEALRREVQVLRGQLQPALVRVRTDSSRLMHRGAVRRP